MTNLPQDSMPSDVIHAAIRLLPILNRKLVHPNKTIYPPDVTPSQLDTLFNIADAKEIRMMELAEHCCMRKQQLTPIVNALENAGYVMRTVDPNNRRIVRASLTERGRALLLEVDANIVAALEPRFGVFSEQEAEELYRCAVKLFSLLEKMP